MRVRVFDPKPTEPSSAFEPQETPLLGGRETGLVVQLGAAPGQVAYDDVAALAVFQSREKGSDQGFLLFFLGGRPRPVLAQAGHIRFNEFPFRLSASGSENVRQVAIHLCRQADSLLVDRSTLTFMKNGGALPLLESSVSVLATAFGRQLMPQASSAFSPHRTRPLPPPAPQPAAPQPPAPQPAAPQPAAPQPPSVAIGPAPISTQRRPAVTPPAPRAPAPMPPATVQPAPPPPAPPPPAPPPPAPPPPAPPQAAPPAAAPPAPPPATAPPAAVASPDAFRPMEVQVFVPALDIEDPSYQPHGVVRVGGSTRGLEISPASVGSVVFEDVQGLAVFSSSQSGGEKTFLMLVVRDGPRPLLAEAGQVAFDDFPIRVSTHPSESLRQLALYVCQKSGRMVMDQETAVFLQRGGSAPILENGMLALASAFCRVLPRSNPGASRSPPAEPMGDSQGFSVASGPPLGDFLPSFSEDPVEGSSAASARAFEEAFASATSEPAAPPKAAGTSEAPYSMWAAFAYPLRGLGALVLVGIVVYFSLAVFVGFGNPLGAGTLLLNLGALFFVPPILFGIVRSTAGGDNTLEELPSFFDFGPRFSDLFSYILLCLLPGAVVFAGYLLIILAGAAFLKESIAGLVVIGGGMLVGYLLFLGIWTVGLGATAVYDGFAIPIRVDLHLRALFRCWQPVAGMFLQLILLLLAGSIALAVALAALPLPDPSLGSPSSLLIAALPGIVMAAYFLVEIPHLVGLLYRRHREKLASIYLKR